MSKDSSVSIVLAVWNQLGYTTLAVESLLKNTDTPFELVIVDNGSRPDIRAYFESLKVRVAVNYIRNERNLGPIVAINQGLAAARHDFICVVHNDVVIMENGWIRKILSYMEADESIGIAGLAGRQEILKTGCVNEESLKHNLQNEDLNEPMQEEVAEVAVVDGLCFVIRRSLLDRIKGLDETYGYMHFYDLDLSLKARSEGFRNVVVKVSAMHIGNGGMTRKLREYKDLVKDDYGLWKKNCRIFANKWRAVLPVKV